MVTSTYLKPLCGNIIRWISILLLIIVRVFLVVVFWIWAGWLNYFTLFSHVTNSHSSGSALATSSSLTVSVWYIYLVKNCYQAIGLSGENMVSPPCLELQNSHWFSLSHTFFALALSHQISNEESSSSNLHAFSSSSSQAVNPSPTGSLAVSSSTSNGLHSSGTPGLTQNGTNTTLSVAGSRTAPLLTATSGRLKGPNKNHIAITKELISHYSSIVKFLLFLQL